MADELPPDPDHEDPAPVNSPPTENDSAGGELTTDEPSVDADTTAEVPDDTPESADPQSAPTDAMDEPPPPVDVKAEPASEPEADVAPVQADGEPDPTSLSDPETPEIAADTPSDDDPSDASPETVDADGEASDSIIAAGGDADSEPAEPEPSNKKWYVVKVTSGREDTIKAAIERRVKIEGLEEFYGQIVVPVERVTVVKKVKTTKNGEKITKETRGVKNVKKYPGYIMAKVEFNDRILYLFRETSGVGDFVGAAGPLKPPAPMTDIEVRRMLGEAVTADDVKKGKDVVIKLDYEKGDKVRIREGAFANMEGEVKEIAMPKDSSETPKVKVEVTIFGRGVPVDLDYWQVDKL